MFLSPNLGLTIWDSGTDPYDSTQLATNWAIVDQHDHTPGKGLPINTNAIVDGSITSSKLAPGVIPAPVGPGTITSAQIATGAIGSSQIANGAIGVAQLATLPAARATNSTTTNVSSVTTLSFSTLVYDSNGITSLPGTTFTCQTNGTYIILGELQFTPQSGATGNVDLYLYVNGVSKFAEGTYMYTSGGLGLQVSGIQRFNATDTITVQVDPGGQTIAMTYRAFSISLVSP